MTMQRHRKKGFLKERLDSAGWAAFLIMVGVLWLLPDQLVPEGAWLIGAGLILLGVNAARALTGVRVSDFTVFVGILALVSGVGEYNGIELFFPALLILIGASVVLKAVIKNGDVSSGWWSETTRMCGGWLDQKEDTAVTEVT